MECYLCIHGHFYQPPRENPWLEAIERQESAYPYHDWNERITAECYAPNSASRILDAEGRIQWIVNNYSKISFNFGPTLLAWMEEKDPVTYQAVLRADQESLKNFGGHGSALAQAYNHLILPLSTRRDKETQILWGLADFEHRFGRKPEGMWLPETAVDLESLEILAEQGLAFTILAPSQARRVRALGARSWHDVSGGRIDPSRAYRVRLPSRRSINLFFYDGPISRAVAFEHLLSSGENFAGRLLGAFSDARTWPQLIHIATDGETYGHHFTHGDMALAYALHQIESNNLARLANYAEYLEKNPPENQVEIFENSSWSCPHGVERWRSDCGCNSGASPGWNQQWRAPLRQAFDWLRDDFAPHFERAGGELFKNPWAARNAYVGVILDRSGESVERFFAEQAGRTLDDGEKIRALKLMELQRHAMLMYTSCGWFFDELSGIETVQVIQYAGRALQLAEELFGDGREAKFLEMLAEAKSNLPEHRDGRIIFEKFVKPARIDLEKAAAHYAVSSLFDHHPERTRVYCYGVSRQDFKLLEAGKLRMALGRADIVSEITRDSLPFTFGILHLGDHHVYGSVRQFQGEEAYDVLLKESAEAFEKGDIPDLIRIVEKNFGSDVYSLRLLFRDEQRRILRLILDSALSDAEALYRRFYEEHSSLLRFVTTHSMPLPRRFKMAAEFVLNLDLQRAFEAGELDFHHIHHLIQEGIALGAALDQAGNEFVLRRTLDRLAEQVDQEPESFDRLIALEKGVDVARAVPFDVNLWKPQNVCFDILHRVRPKILERMTEGDTAAGEWAGRFAELGEKLRVFVPPLEGEAGS
jgi:alpha-amylase/alpha-mannosidase (GH57 family)